MRPEDADTPVTEAELHAWLDGQLPAARQQEIEAYLASRPEEAARLADYRGQKAALRALFDPVLDEAAPARLLRAAAPRQPWYAQRWVAGLALLLLGTGAGWGMRSALPAGGDATALALAAARSPEGFARRAAVAHAVFSPDQRRAVELDAAHEEQLSTWLSRRMGAAMKPPHLQAQGYALEGGRLLPGGQGPVAQFMYRDSEGRKLTVYVSNELGPAGAASAPAHAGVPASAMPTTAFRFAREGRVNVFYWVDGAYGYAITADAGRQVLADVSNEVYRQLVSE
ncbi:anti-sigma factor [Ideonella azotifigens]|uniref:Anti-sigma factor n=2 Tax=Ideonella azotifigens TaxID=513160 RepID=A0ABN1KK27_9BURK|nr:anti-sigma factor [Ideonella azotifigens]MCD2339297.1 anti-sigma factor [Ideonella azotifigens]